MDFEELEEMIMQEVAEAKKKDAQSGCSFEQPWEKQDKKFAHDKSGIKVAQLAAEIVKKATGKAKYNKFWKCSRRSSRCGDGSKVC